MSDQFSHPVKAETVQVLHLKNRPQAELHKAGCQHAAKAHWVGEPQNAAEMVRETETIYVYDYYHVAPCARRA